MSETKKQISRMGIRQILNLIFTMMKLLATVLEMEPDGELVLDTLASVTDGIRKEVEALVDDVNRYIADASKQE